MSSTGGSSSTAGGGPAGGAPASTGGSLSRGGTSSGGSKASGGVSGGGGSTTSGGATTGGAGGGAPPSQPSKCVATVAAMKVGWNLGNSLDCTAPDQSDTAAETAWGNPRITPELFDAVSKAGFGAVRIPVTWIGRMGDAPDYTIRETFIARVEEVVKYALERELYVIINVHHDGAEGVEGQWISLVDSAGQVTAANSAQVRTRLQRVWAQIADHFADYGDHLIFESMNEIHVGYDTPPAAQLELVNDWNQAFVDTVRASGGNNPERCLVVPGYNTNIDHTVAGFVAPNDPANRLILSAHYYDPWDYAGAGVTHAWGAGNPGIDTWGQEDHVNTQVAKLKTNYIDRGLPVIWGEYGAVHQAGYENYRRYYLEYVTKATRDAGIVPIYWDNGGLNSGEDGFGLFNRTDNTVAFPTMLEAIQRAVTSNYSLADVAKP
jgi:endoglucanase